MAFEADVFFGGISNRLVIKVSSRVRLSAHEHFLNDGMFLRRFPQPLGDFIESLKIPNGSDDSYCNGYLAFAY